MSPPIPASRPSPKPRPRPGPSPVPTLVPAPPSLPLPWEFVGAAGGASIAPGNTCVPRARVSTGMTTSGAGSRSGGAGAGESIARGLVAGTVRESCPGSSARRGGSFIRLPPLPPPPLGPGSFNQTMRTFVSDAFAVSECDAFVARVATTTSIAIAACAASDTRNAPPDRCSIATRFGRRRARKSRSDSKMFLQDLRYAVRTLTRSAGLDFAGTLGDAGRSRSTRARRGAAHLVHGVPSGAAAVLDDHARRVP